MGKHDFSLDVVASDQSNEDGTSRQQELLCCRPGESVRLVRERDRPEDDMAVAVHSARRVKIGYIGWDRSKWIGEKIDARQAVWAIVERVSEGPDGNRVLTLRINLHGQEPRLPLAEQLA